jgi:TonB family protein
MTRGLTASHGSFCRLDWTAVCVPHYLGVAPIRPFRLTLRCLLCLAIFATAGCGRKSTAQLVGESPAAQSPSPPVVSNSPQAPTSSSSPTQAVQAKAGQQPTLDLARLENSVRPAVFWIAVFDSSGKLLRTETAFFISGDGKFITTARAIEGGMNAVAKMADGRIYNVRGVLAASTTLDLAVLQADAEYVPFLTLNKIPNFETGTRVGVVGSALAGSAEGARETSILMQQPDRVEIAATSPPESIGSPVVDANDQIVGVVISAGEKVTVRPSNTISSLLDRIASDAKPRWSEVAQASITPTPTPRPTPKPRLVFAPAPAFPSEVRSRPGASWSGRFRLNFNARGNVTNVQIVQSTGSSVLDQSALSTLRQWKSAPGQEWVATVPVTFQSR